MVSLVCISDSHLGYRHRFKVERLKDYQRSFQEAMGKVRELRPEVLVLGGDLLHHAKPDPKSMRIFLRELIKTAEGTQIIISIGNHEISGHLGTTYAPIYSDIHRNIHVLSTETPHVKLKVHGKQIGFHGFQFLRTKNTAEEALERISGEVTDNDYNILCLHQAIEKYLNPYEISLRCLREVAKKYDLILLGHVHRFQQVEQVSDITPAFYIGSTEKISFNEWKNENGFLVFRDWNFKEPEFMRISSAPMKYVRQDLGKKTPDEVNDHIESVIKENSDVKLLQISIEVAVDGDYLNIKHEWSEKYPDFTILDVNVTPKMTGKTVTIEKLKINENLIKEYFEKSELNDDNLLQTCLELYGEYGI